MNDMINNITTSDLFDPIANQFDDTLLSVKDLVDSLGPIKFEQGIIGEQGDFQYIEVDKLNVDPSYQRFVSKTTILKAKIVNLYLLQPLVVWVRPCGTYISVDGQHKSIMVFLGAGKNFKVPCQVFYHPKDRTNQQCREFEAKMFERLNMSRKNVTGLDKYRTGIVIGEESAIEFERNLISIGVYVENLGDLTYGTPIRGWTKTKASWEKFGIRYTKNAVDFLKPIYKNSWNKDAIDGSMIFGLASIFYLMDQHCGKGKAEGLRKFLDTLFPKTRSNKWLEKCSGDSDYIIIARRIVDKYNMYLNDGVLEEGSIIGETIMANAGLGSLDNI